MRLGKLLFTALMLLPSAVVAVQAQVPTTMNVQGRLTDSTGAPTAMATPQFDFSIWDAQAGGTQLWPVSGTEPHVITTDAAGLWDARIGTTIPLTPGVFVDSSRWLQIIVDAGAGPTLLPRVRLDTSPFAFRAATSQFADSAAGISGSEPGPYLPLAGGTMTGDVFSIGEPSITMGKGNFGPANVNSGPQAFVAGSLNRAVGEYSVVSGGQYNYARGAYSAIAGGGGTESDSNSASGPYSSIGGGHSNLASGNGSSVGGGESNHATNDQATVGGGIYNEANGSQSTVGGGSVNVASGQASSVGAGVGNRATGYGARVCAGDGNLAYGNVSTISGGERDTVFGSHAMIGGGELNTASGAHSTIGGGIHNRTTADFSTIGGGSGNTTSGLYSVVTGGGDDWSFYPNVASGNWSTVAGGRGNLAEGDYSFCAGRSARAMHAGSFVWADTTFNTFTDDRANEFAISAENGLRVESNNTAYAAATLQNSSTGWGAYISNESNELLKAAIYAVNFGTGPALYAVGGNLAALFAGDVTVSGTLTKGAGAFKIDHPLDPADKYLLHSFVESPDMKNVYDGTIRLDDNGEAWIDLPDWFEALNRDFRYQLTCVGGYAPVYIADEISGNRFRIAGGKPGLKVSWQVTGIRQDAYANAHRIPVEEDKAPDERGKYLHPEALGFSKSLGIAPGASEMAPGSPHR